jgi:hypothetical protein
VFPLLSVHGLQAPPTALRGNGSPQVSVSSCRRHFRLKAGVIKEQMRGWVRDDAGLSQVAAQVAAALDQLIAHGGEPS